jgi:hypothetical protein
MEQWTRLDGPAVRVHCKLTNNRSDHTQYPSYRSTWGGEELPAAYGVGAFCHLFTYIGAAPFTGGALTEESATWPAPGWRATDPKPPAAHQSSAGFSRVKRAKKANKSAMHIA